MTRKEAKSQGLLTYESSPCGKCESLVRYVSSGDCVACSKAKSAQKYRKDPKAARDRNRKWLYGITPEQYAAMRGDHCEICSRSLLKPVVDHCHNSGRVRAIICNNCNVGLGAFSDNPDALRRAAEYLEKHHGEQAQAA